MDQPEQARAGSGAPRPLKRMFDAVPRRYDLLNRLLTLRFDEHWRSLAARECLAGQPARVLDLCCGTGDLALRLASLADGTEIHALDYSVGMLDIARRKAERSGAGRGIQFVEGDAAALPFPDGHFDAVGIAFAFRNLTWHNPLMEQALSEVLRVLRPGGRFVIVETSQPANRLLRAGFHLYLRLVAAPLGSALSGHAGAYRYLALSARGFYSAPEVCALLKGAGFGEATYQHQLGGVAAIHVALKPALSHCD